MNASVSTENQKKPGLRRRTSANAVAAALQAAIGGIVIFVTYKFLVINIGTAGIGAWSLALTLSTVASLPGVGVQGAIQHFVADRAGRGDLRGAADVIVTSLVAIAMLVGVGVAVAVLLLPRLLPLIVGTGDSSDVVHLLPWGLGCGWLLTMSASLQFCFDGLQKATTRAWIFLGATVFYMFLAITLTRYLGLPGLAWANLIEYVLLFLTLMIMLARWFVANRIRRAAVRPLILKEIFVYSTHSQALGIASLIFDPLTRSLLGHYSGLAEIGLFDMASRMVIQLRTVLVGACSILVPVFSVPREIAASDAMRRRYVEVLAIITSATLTVILGLEGTSLGLSAVWLGSSSRFFVLAVTLLSVGWGLNSLAAPAYMTLMGWARLRWNVIGQYATLAVLAGVGAALAPPLKGPGVLIAYVLALVVGGLVPLWYVHRALSVTIKEWLRAVDWRLAAYAFLACCAGWVVYLSLSGTTSTVRGIGMICSCLLILGLGFVRSQTRRTLTTALGLRVRDK
jgi:O-antigen/teichoic acid export membrane protein